MSQSQPLRIEDPTVGSFGTSRTINQRLWFVNNPKLEENILGWLAKYREKYAVSLYAFAIQGNHHHVTSKFPNQNRAAFYRDFNARFAQSVKRFVPEFEGGPLFERRYSEQALPHADDIEEQFFYSAMQPIRDGLVDRLSEYPGYNSFNDAICGRKREIRKVNWTAYHAAKRHDPTVPIKNFYEYYTLEYQRLPGYEHLSQRDYRELMLKKFEERRIKIINELKAHGHRFGTRTQLMQTKPGSRPKNSKVSGRYSRRPLVLSKCAERKRSYLERYFAIFRTYKSAVKCYFAGMLSVEFPPGTYRPPLFLAT